MTTHALLWSQRNNALHVETVEAMLSRGRVAYTADRPTHYVPLLIGSWSEVHAAADAARQTLAERSRSRVVEVAHA